MTDDARRGRPWHVTFACIYLTLAGTWAWIGMWWLVMGQGDLVTTFLMPVVLGFAVALANLAGAFLLFRLKKWALVPIALIPILQWASFATMNHFSAIDYVLDAEFVRQLPKSLLAALTFGVGLMFYATMLVRYRIVR